MNPATPQPARINTDRLRELATAIRTNDPPAWDKRVGAIIQRDFNDIAAALDELIAARESSPCVPDPFSSRTCERGTKACNVRHTQQPAPAAPPASPALVAAAEAVVNINWPQEFSRSASEPVWHNDVPIVVCDVVDALRAAVANERKRAAAGGG